MTRGNDRWADSSACKSATIEPETSWSEWLPLRGISRNPAVPRTPGIYRVRRVGRNELDYIGQTGRNLRERLGALSRCYNDEMPYRDPHTAAPALWALRHSSGCEFEASVYPLDVDAPTRKGREALEIALYRQQCGNSPTVQFGRVPLGYRASSQNNSRLVAAGARFRGGAYSGPPLAEHHVGTGPKGRLSPPAPQTESWCGHSWSAWLPLHEVGRTSLRSPSGFIAYEEIPAANCCMSVKARFRTDLGHTSPKLRKRTTHRVPSWRCRRASKSPG